MKNQQTPRQNPSASRNDGNLFKGGLFGILFSVPLWIVIYLFIKYMMNMSLFVGICYT
ncbi:hypothetical protein S101359_03779 [Bacillus atrophaeus]|nr:hypothetical protein S101359_03779 [Bacillus atrophaeus]